MDRHPIGNGACTPRIPREIAALIAALQLKGGNTEALGELKQQEWESLLQFCDLAHLTLSLAQVESSRFPSWVIERLKRNRADNAARFDRVRHAYQEAAAALDRSGIDHVVLKGFTQSPEYVVNPCLRVQSDLDIYCPREMIAQARTGLEQIGYQSEQARASISRADHLPALIRIGDWQWRGNAFDPDMPLSIELHFCFWNEDVSWFFVPEADSFWDRRINRSLEGMSFPALNRVDHLGYLTLHILRDLLIGDWIIHHVHELARFLHGHARDDEFWKEWSETHSDSFRALQALAFYHARTWFFCDVHPAVQNEIATLPTIHRKWLEYFVGSALEGMFRKNKDRVWLHASLVKPARKKVALIWKTIVPTRKQLSPIDSPAVGIKNRQSKEARFSNRYFRYAAYMVDRTIAHARPVPSLMWHGLILWWSQRQFRRQF